jgi:hypothetical protein
MNTSRFNKAVTNVSASIVLLAMMLVVGCHVPGGSGQPEFGQGVTGTLRLKPGYDASDGYYLSHPPDLTPRPIPGATVYLVKRQSVPPTSSDVLAKVLTDSLGRYEIKAEPGNYNVAVSGDGIESQGLLYRSHVSAGLGFPVVAFLPIEIQAGTFLTQDVELHEVVPQ